MSGDLLDFLPRSPGHAAEVAPLPRVSWESSSLGLSVLFCSDDGGGNAGALDEAHAEALAEARALERHNAQLMAALIARRGRLREAEAEEDEARQQAQLEAAEAEVCREQAHVRMLRQLLQRTDEDADAAEAATLVEQHQSEQAHMLQSEIEEQRIVLSAMREQLAAAPPRLRGRGCPGNRGGLHAIDAGSEVDATLERSFAMRLTEDLRTELQAVQQELAAQQLHGSGITNRTEVLEEELRTLRAELRDHGRQSESLLGQGPPLLTATQAVCADRAVSSGAPLAVQHAPQKCHAAATHLPANASCESNCKNSVLLIPGHLWWAKRSMRAERVTQWTASETSMQPAAWLACCSLWLKLALCQTRGVIHQ